MAEEKKQPETNDKKELKRLRDLQPRKDMKGGARNEREGEKRPLATTGEIDFMNLD